VSISEKWRIMKRGERARAVVLDISHVMITYPYENLIEYYTRRNLHPDLVSHSEVISSVLLLRILLALNRAVALLSVDRILQNWLFFL
jgi:hypothetical protein